MPNVYGYLRVSTIEQVHGLDAQRDCIKRNFEYLFKDKKDDKDRAYAWAGEFVDHGVSGGTAFRQRPEGAKLSVLLEAGDVVLVSKLDRAFRNVRDAAETLEWFIERKVWLVIVDMGIDTRTIIGKMLVAILAAVATFERDRLGERCREAHLAAKARGERHHDGRKWGFKLSKKRPGQKRKFIPDPYVRHCAQLFVKWQDEEGLGGDRIYIRCLVERIDRICIAGRGRGKEWSQGAIDRALVFERKMQEYELIHGPVCPPEAIAAIKVGKFQR